MRQILTIAFLFCAASSLAAEAPPKRLKIADNVQPQTAQRAYEVWQKNEAERKKQLDECVKALRKNRDDDAAERKMKWLKTLNPFMMPMAIDDAKFTKGMVGAIDEKAVVGYIKSTDGDRELFDEKLSNLIGEFGLYVQFRSVLPRTIFAGFDTTSIARLDRVVIRDIPMEITEKVRIDKDFTYWILRPFVVPEDFDPKAFAKKEKTRQPAVR